MSTWEIVVAVAKVFPALHPAEIWAMREDVALDVLEAHGRLRDRAEPAAGVAPTPATMPWASRSTAGKERQYGVMPIADFHTAMQREQLATRGQRQE